MFKFMSNRKKQNRRLAEDWFDELDDESQQETAVKYLRKLDNFSLKKLYAAVDLYRKGDIELRKVKEPEEPVAQEEKSEDVMDSYVETDNNK